jgi:predicted DNA-binding protein
MEKLDLNSFTKEQIAMAKQCKTPEELIELAKKACIELTKEQAEAYLAELQDIELDPEVLERVAGGGISSLKPAKTKKLFIPTVNIL